MVGTVNEFERIGHGGASALAPGNTLESFDAAVEVGIDMVEFDVRACSGELVLAHTVLHGRRGGACACMRRSPISPAGALPTWRSTSTSSTSGARPRCSTACATPGCCDRALLSSQVPGVLDRLRRAEPALASGSPWAAGWPG